MDALQQAARSVLLAFILGWIWGGGIATFVGKIPSINYYALFCACVSALVAALINAPSLALSFLVQ